MDNNQNTNSVYVGVADAAPQLDRLQRGEIVRKAHAANPNATHSELHQIINHPEISERCIQNARYSMRTGRARGVLRSPRSSSMTQTAIGSGDGHAVVASAVAPQPQSNKQAITSLIRSLRATYRSGREQIVTDGVTVAVQTLDRADSYFELLISQLKHMKDS
jgi:hypothetical protein